MDLVLQGFLLETPGLETFCCCPWSWRWRDLRLQGQQQKQVTGSWWSKVPSRESDRVCIGTSSMSVERTMDLGTNCSGLETSLLPEAGLQFLNGEETLYVNVEFCKHFKSPT